MPLYEFKCQDCQQDFEILRPISQVDESPPPCEYCGSRHTNRKLSTVIAFIGSGSERKSLTGSSCGSCSSVGSGACSSCSTGR